MSIHPKPLLIGLKDGMMSFRVAANGWVFTNTGLKIPKFSTETEREKKADTRFEDFNPVFANTML